jgi:ABC-type amino acid transport substrate-binding protein
MASSRMLTAAALAALMVLTGCSAPVMPADPDGTLATVRGGELRAGVTPAGGLVDVTGAEPTGDEADAVRAFARSLDAEVDWTVASEETLVRGLEDGELDLVAGGITDETPWVDRAGVTRGYREVVDERGRTHMLVMLVPLGENAFLSELETFLPAYVEEEATR